MSEQTVYAVVGATVGFVIGGPTGAQIGWGLGMAIGAPDAPRPPVGDLTIAGLQYGVPLPRVWGTVVTAGALAWSSDKRATAQEAEGGKGGGEQITGYSYSADLMFIVAAESDVVALTRVWRNGKLVYSARAGASDETYVQSSTTDLWDAIELRTGGPTQTPWDIYEAAVGTADALAYRRRATVCITNARFGNSPTPPTYLFEVITAGTQAEGDVFWLLNADQANGTTTAVDSSSWGHTVSVVGIEQQAASAVFGASGFTNNTTGYSLSGSMTVPFDAATDGLTAEGWMRIDGEPGSGFTVVQISAGSATMRVYVDDDLSPDNRRLVLVVGGQSLNAIDVLGPDDYPLPRGTYFHWALDWNPDTGTATFYVNGTQAHALTYSGTVPTTVNATSVSTGGGAAGTVEQDGIRVTRRYRRYTSDFTVPSSAPTDDIPGPWTLGTEDLDDVVSDLCVACPPLSAGMIDVTALSGTAVRGFAAVGSPRQALEQLAGAFYFGCHVTDKLYFVDRGGASAVTIPYASLGAGVGSPSDEPIGLERGNNDEIPRKLALTYVNINADHEKGTVTGDRGSGGERQVETAELSVVLTPTEAQRIADAWAMDRRVAATTFKPSLTDYYAQRTPTDVITLTDADGTTYRARIVASDDSQGVKALECVLDDASVLTQTSLASDYTTPTISVPLQSETTLRLLDIPILRDADNDAGFYMAVTRTTAGGAWPGCTVAESADGTVYENIATITSEAVTGQATTELGDWTGGNVMDHASTVTIQITGTASSYTDDQVLAGTAQAWLIGDEIVTARTATLVSAGVYTLSNLLRGQRGTEWATGTHAVGDRVVALSASTLRRGDREAGQLDVAYSFKAPTFGRSLTTTAAQSFTDTGVGLKPFSPADVEVDRDASNNATITVRRRSRLSHRFLRDGIDTPLGEADESYSVDAYTDGTYTTVAATFTFTGSSGSFTAAAQTTAGLTPGNTLYLAVHQLSAVVGRGYEKRAAA